MNTEWQEIPAIEDPQTSIAPPKARPLSALTRPDRNDASELLKNRFLCRLAFMLLCGPTGIGKSSFIMQCMVLWALALDAFGIAPTRPLKSLLIQSENDDGDLAEMRDGVIGGLALTPAQMERALANIVVWREDERTGSRFFAETVKPLLTETKPDVLWIDPALAYLGGESNSQRDVGLFLRNYLNPLLREFNCGCVIVHHTNKPPSGKEKPDWAGGDFAYLGAGSAEWANAARAVLALRSIGSHDVFELIAGKRGGRLGWKDEEGKKCFKRYLSHAKEPGVICWHEIDPSEAGKGGRPKDHDITELPGPASAGRIAGG